MLLGGGGFIGNAVARALVANGQNVLVLNRTGQSSVPGVAVCTVDRASPTDVLRATERFSADIIIDMIAFEEADTLPLLDCLQGSVRRYVLISSCDVYAAFGRLLGTEAGATDNTVLCEDAPLRTRLYPFRGKMAGRQWYDKIPLEQAALGCADLESVILRLPMVFGPGDPRRRFQHLCQALMMPKRTITLSGKEARWKSPLLHVDDVARAIALAATHSQTPGGIFNIGPETHVSESQRALAFARAIGRTIKLEIKSEAKEGTGQNFDQHVVLSSALLRRLTGWLPRLTDDEAYQSVWAWEQEAALL